MQKKCFPSIDDNCNFFSKRGWLSLRSVTPRFSYAWSGIRLSKSDRIPFLFHSGFAYWTQLAANKSPYYVGLKNIFAHARAVVWFDIFFEFFVCLLKRGQRAHKIYIFIFLLLPIGLWMKFGRLFSIHCVASWPFAIRRLHWQNRNN